MILNITTVLVNSSDVSASDCFKIFWINFAVAAMSPRTSPALRQIFGNSKVESFRNEFLSKLRIFLSALWSMTRMSYNCFLWLWDLNRELGCETKRQDKFQTLHVTVENVLHLIVNFFSTAFTFIVIYKDTVCLISLQKVTLSRLLMLTSCAPRVVQ